MFYKVVWQHMQGKVGFVIMNLLQIYQWKDSVNRWRSDRIMAMSLWPHFFNPPCTRQNGMAQLLIGSGEWITSPLKNPGLAAHWSTRIGLYHCWTYMHLQIATEARILVWNFCGKYPTLPNVIVDPRPWNLVSRHPMPYRNFSTVIAPIKMWLRAPKKKRLLGYFEYILQGLVSIQRHKVVTSEAL